MIVITLVVYREYPVSPEGNDPLGNMCPIRIKMEKTDVQVVRTMAEEIARSHAEKTGSHVQVWDVAED